MTLILIDFKHFNFLRKSDSIHRRESGGGIGVGQDRIPTFNKRHSMYTIDKPLAETHKC